MSVFFMFRFYTLAAALSLVLSPSLLAMKTNIPSEKQDEDTSHQISAKLSPRYPEFLDVTQLQRATDLINQSDDFCKSTSITNNCIRLAHKDNEPLAVFKRLNILSDDPMRNSQKYLREEMIPTLANAASLGRLVTPTIRTTYKNEDIIIGEMISLFPKNTTKFDTNNDIIKNVLAILKKESIFNNEYYEGFHYNLGNIGSFLNLSKDTELSDDEKASIKTFLNSIDQEDLEQSLLLGFLLGMGDGNSGTYVLSVAEDGKIHCKVVDFECWFEDGRFALPDEILGLPQFQRPMSEKTLNLIDLWQFDHFKAIIDKFHEDDVSVAHFQKRLDLLKKNKKHMKEDTLLEINDGLCEIYSQYKRSYKDSHHKDLQK